MATRLTETRIEINKTLDALTNSKLFNLLHDNYEVINLSFSFKKEVELEYIFQATISSNLFDKHQEITFTRPKNLSINDFVNHVYYNLLHGLSITKFNNCARELKTILGVE